MGAEQPLTITDLVRIGRPAPGATPGAKSLYRASPEGAVDGWLEPDGKGYIRVPGQSDRVVRIDDAHAWSLVSAEIGLVDSQPQRKAAPGGSVVTPSDYQEQDGIMIALMVPPGDAQDLALDGPAAADPTGLHLTLAFLGSTDAVDDVGAFYAAVLDALRDTASESDPISGMVSGVGRFTIDGGSDAFVYLYDSPQLPDLRQDLVEALEEQGISVSDEHGFQPHITVAYLQEGEDNPIRRAEPRVLSFDAITFCFGDQRLPIKLGGPDPDEADESFASDATGYGIPDTTAPTAMVVGGKARPNPFAKGGKKKGGPAFAAGSFVSWGSSKGRVDLVVTNGKVPGVEEDVTGSATSPAVRVVVWEQGAGGKWKATGRKVGVSMSSLKRTLPLNFNGGKKDLDPDEALVDVLTGYYEQAAETKDLPLVDPVAVRTVYERGLESWPGADVGVAREPWALGRTKAFLTVAAGDDVPGYEADRDLLPAGHALATLDAVTGDGEEKVAATLVETNAIDAAAVQSVLDGLRGVLGNPFAVE